MKKIPIAYYTQSGQIKEVPESAQFSYALLTVV